MSHSNELVLHFLGKRSYLHGTTMFDALAGFCSKGRNISFRISRLIESDRVKAEPFELESENVGPFSATLVWEESGMRRAMGVVPLVPSSVPLRMPFAEDTIVGRAEFSRTTVTTKFQGTDTLVRNIVPLNKALLLRVLDPPAPGQWLFVRLDLERWIGTFNELRISYRKHLAFAAVSSSIEIDGHETGTVVFSWLKK